ncbi:MAG: hypothetical protein ISS91_02245 [Candidatus Omnitrophica bacterium]|nr:hypothetical protein [Candidatus Omnitrophota bacterium]
MSKPKKIRQRLLWSGALLAVISCLSFILFWTFIVEDIEVYLNDDGTSILSGWFIIAFLVGIFVFLVGIALFLYQKIKKHSTPVKMGRLEG